MDFVRNDQASQYQAVSDGDVLAVIDFHVNDQVATFTHTGTEPEAQGQGLAGQLTDFALQDLRERGLKVSPKCPFTKRWIDKFDQYADLLA